MSDPPLCLGTEPARALASRLGARWLGVPEIRLDARWSGGAELEAWRGEVTSGPPAPAVIVAVWPDIPQRSTLVDTGWETWLATVETPYALWFAALAAGARRCADGGRVIALVDRPAPKDSGGWSAPSAVADAVEVLVHSLAEVHRPRGIGVNLVTTPARLAGGEGATEAELAATVSMLLAASTGLTSVVIPLGAGH
jgi:NAD(P)-dependent dehydrogenase (short-subunit alcohol dehydrogenase family)